MPLLLLALGLGLALTAYELSPSLHTRVDYYVGAIRAAHAAHAAADAHLANTHVATATAARHAQASLDERQAAHAESPLPAPAPHVSIAPAVPSPPSSPPFVAAAHDGATQVAIDAGVDHAAAATAANQVAAKSTAAAAEGARTETERREAAQSAARVLEREKKIAQARATLGVGQCGVRSYAGATPQVTDLLMTRLHAEGMAVTGANPWNVETNQYGVRLRAAWDPATQVLRVVVTTGAGGYAGLVSCDKIWEKIEPIVRGVIGG